MIAVRLIIVIVTAIASSIPTAARAQKAAPEIKVTGSGNGRACERDADTKAMNEAISSILHVEHTMASTSLQCLVLKAGRTQAVRLKPRRTAKIAADRCEVVYSVVYDRPAVLAADRACRRTDVRIPVGVVLRGEVGAKADASLTQQAISQITNALGQSNFEIVSLPQFQNEFLDLKLLVGDCPFTGAARVADWTDECKRRFDNYSAARGALSNKVSEAVAVVPALQGWRRCGGLFLSGEVRVTLNAASVRAAIDVDYFALVDTVTFIAPFSDARSAPIQQGGSPLAVDSALAQVADAAATDAIQKLARFAQTRGCAASQG